MKREEIFEYVKDEYDSEPQYLWEKSPSYAVLRHENGKWYGIVMNIQKEKLGLKGTDEVDILDVKCTPEFIGGLRKEKGFFPAYHMNKEHWITIILDGSVSNKKIEEMLDLSYELTIK